MYAYWASGGTSYTNGPTLYPALDTVAKLAVAGACWLATVPVCVFLHRLYGVGVLAVSRDEPEEAGGASSQEEQKDEETAAAPPSW